MKFSAKTIALKNGAAALLRPPGEADGAALSAFERQRAEETELMLRYPDECLDAGEMCASVRSFLLSETDVMIVCETGGRIVGCCEMVRHKLRKTAHRAEISLGNLRTCWGLGIGTALLRETIALARRQGVARLELNVFEGNDRAMALYRKMGFVPAARRPDCVRLQNGASFGACSMFLTLD